MSVDSCQHRDIRGRDLEELEIVLLLEERGIEHGIQWACFFPDDKGMTVAMRAPG